MIKVFNYLVNFSYLGPSAIWIDDYSMVSVENKYYDDNEFFNLINKSIINIVKSDSHNTNIVTANGEPIVKILNIINITKIKPILET